MKKPRPYVNKNGKLAMDLQYCSVDDGEILIVGKKRRAYMWIGGKHGHCLAHTGAIESFLTLALEHVTGRKVVLK